MGSSVVGKNTNTNPNLADEELFSAKDSSYNVSKQLNTSLESNRTSLMLCNKLDNASSVVSVSTCGKLTNAATLWHINELLFMSNLLLMPPCGIKVNY